MRDDFEASFSDQLAAIEAEAAPVAPTAVSARLLETPEFAPFCFAYPAPDSASQAQHPAALLADLTWNAGSHARATSMLSAYADDVATRDSLLLGVDDESQLAVARILAILVCAEESAVNVFHHECHRIPAEQVVADHQALREIEAEERVHAWLIHAARSHLPVPDDIDAIRRRTRRLFMRVASREVATHFARLTGLDSGVCISLSALLGSSRVNKIDGFARLIKHIRRDEATHVKKSRDHAVNLGFNPDQFHECYDLTRSGMVGMLEPIAGSFETLGVDPDRLFKRLMRFQESRLAGEAALAD